ncbi:methionine biosynthesis PLP-dependent protein [Lactobacillus sp. S2-2]|uniref:PLP-dependent transferase n=1 Tax=Lactobacillus sp. S2-2 TaxID=2692917 RepID=UPI001F0045FE|nr:PLP-dependent transferase [Lactobacillus sp. S2-2]MCF6515739.1 methionine biosynthesis PLP-dependent protein [Lactobacillus sp. S2-2]
MCSNDRRIDTILAQAGNRVDQETGAISMPLYFSTAFRHQGLGESTGYDYSRMNEPTRKELEKVLAIMENGSHAFAVTSGMAAIQLVFTQFKMNDHIIISDDLYGGSYRFFDLLKSNYHLKFSKWDGKNYEKLETMINEYNPKAVWIETPSNPLMKEIDIQKTAQIVHHNEAQLIVDNTFYTPLIQKPLNLGADIVVHSATKYLSGHNDLLSGVVVCKNEKIAEVLNYNLVTIGSNLAPFDSWLLIRSLKTLPLRLEKQQNNAQKLVDNLRQQKYISNVLYPGKGGMISAYFTQEINVDKFLRSLSVFSFAESLGGTESLITVPAIQTHANLSDEEKIKTGITNNLIRISCGVENEKDLIHDFNQALSESKLL